MILMWYTIAHLNECLSTMKLVRIFHLVQLLFEHDLIDLMLVREVIVNLFRRVFSQLIVALKGHYRGGKFGARSMVTSSPANVWIRLLHEDLRLGDNRSQLDTLVSSWSIVLDDLLVPWLVCRRGAGGGACHASVQVSRSSLRSAKSSRWPMHNLLIGSETWPSRTLVLVKGPLCMLASVVFVGIQPHLRCCIETWIVISLFIVKLSVLLIA